MTLTESEWQGCTDNALEMLWTLHAGGKVMRTKVGRRKLRLFACGCCRRIWKLLRHRRLRDTVEIAERFSDGKATKKELERAFATARKIRSEKIAAGLVIYTTHHMPFEAAFGTTLLTTNFEKGKGNPTTNAFLPHTILCDLLRCVFGKPFAPIERSCTTAWTNSIVRALSHGIYEDRAFDRLPILADALEEAGCTDDAMLSHCRGPGPHVRGCWVVDLLLGKA
jgi:hypothetical protein